jgi:archaeal flagellar protein FlaI
MSDEGTTKKQEEPQKTSPGLKRKSDVAKKPTKEKPPNPQKEKNQKEQKPLFGKKPSPVQTPSAVFKTMPQGVTQVEAYFVQEPHSKVVVAALPELGAGITYFIVEPKLTPEEQASHRLMVEILSKELEPPNKEENPKTHVSNEARRVAKKYGLEKKIPEESWPRLLYYILRDLVGFGDIDVIMNDPLIEDLSVNGLDLPVYVWHRKYESLPTNLVFTDETSLDNLIVKLTHLSGKHISTAFPILDAMLPGKDRLAATFRREVSPKGGSFSIRRFREEPFSIIDLMDLGTLNAEMAAYFWLLIENRMTIAVIGGTGAGKTSTLNALASLVKPAMKIVTVEEIPELNVPHENWVQLVSRESYGLGAFKEGEVTLFDLVKTSLRYRPDYIVVGEIRGEEAFVLFQALATGHGGLTTLHAESLDYTVKRLTSHPMNVATPYIPLLNAAPLVERVRLPSSEGGASNFGRRIKILQEIADYEKYRTVSEWDPITDTFSMDFKNSFLLKRISDRHRLTTVQIAEEAHRRAAFLVELKAKGIRKNVDLAKQVTNYYAELDHLGLRRK